MSWHELSERVLQDKIKTQSELIEKLAGKLNVTECQCVCSGIKCSRCDGLESYEQWKRENGEK